MSHHIIPKSSPSYICIPSKYLTDSQHTSITFQQFCYNPSQLAQFIKNLSPSCRKDKTLKWMALAAFCQPVLLSQVQYAVQKIINNQCLFSCMDGYIVEDKSYSQITLLQALNIFCLVKGFSLQILNINKKPQIYNNLPQAEALWNNCLPFLTKRENHLECEILLKETEKQSVKCVKDLINKAYTMKQLVNNSLVNNNYFEDNYRHYRQQFNQSSIHPIDIFISQNNCLVSADYLPNDYPGEYIQVWVNRSVQLNSLLGNFVCKQKFGEFQYVKGPLTYAMEKGILLVLNNFQHISNQLLVGMRTLAEEMKIFHNQKTIQARGGFKILGICSSSKMSAKMKSMVNNSQYIAHIELSKRTVLSQLPEISNEANKAFLTEKLLRIESQIGLINSRKLWKRIQRSRRLLVQSQQSERLWSSYYTQGFKDSIQLQINDLKSIIDKQRTIQCQVEYKKIKIGRAVINVLKNPTQKIVKTQYSLSILEKLALCSELEQTPLLISQTGCGKTTLVQYLAELSGHHLYVYNMSSGTDVMDLVGGFKPIDCRSLLKQLFFRFIQKFRQIPGSQKNQQFLQGLMTYYNNGQLKVLLESLSASITKIKINKVTDQKQIGQWDELKKKIDNLYANLGRIDSNLVFSFIEGNLIKALRNGDWVLIDEINMATNDVLQKIIPLIEGKSLLLYEKGDLTYIQRHKDFRIVACMNPANDSGKKPLPPNLMQKFTVINLSEPAYMDISMMIQQIAPQLDSTRIADLYFNVKKQKTTSLRNLSRCLSYINRNKDVYTFQRALYDGLLLGFQQKSLLKNYKNQTPPKQVKGYIKMHGFLLEQGTYKHQGDPEVFHLTQTFLQHLKNFLRAIAGTELPVLLQGPTSAGKTSIIRYVASISGHKCIRINNHEHTQIQQYLGNYFPDRQGKLIFREGPLVKAVRQGHWLILDELNLARTEILQCLNRLLDDNRELFIPEQQTHIKPHKNFRIFATQNPASYSGRKTLSRAFRNRFISLSFDDITIQDTMAIMKVRRPILNDSQQLSAYVKNALENLQHYRQKQRVFSKDNIITIRDLLKWTGRKFLDKQSFMRQGYALLSQRLRTEEEKKFVTKVLFSGSKNSNFDMYTQYQKVVNEHLNDQVIKKSNIYVQMNKSFKRMAALTLKAVMNNEPVLLVGETGCGKTTLAELLASISGRKFYSLNCHKHTQASDLLGCLRPCVKANSDNKFQFVNGVVIDAMLDGAVLLIDEINTAEDSVLQRLNQVLQSNNIGVQRGQGWETITAKQGFSIIGTMNPSGDYGKKQLSPALRNRFTQIWVEPITHPQYIEQGKKDIQQMIIHKLSKPNSKQIFQNRVEIAELVFKFIRDYNCMMAPKYSLTRKLLTMRDIGWICKFMSECEYNLLNDWKYRYYWGLRILAIEGVNFMMGDLTDSFKLNTLKQELIEYIENQINLPSLDKKLHQNPELQAIQIVKQLSFPLLIKTDLPLQLLGVKPDERIFFSPHTQLSDLLGQFRPKGAQFIWEDQTLLKTVKHGNRVALMDLNLAQQPVVEGINSLFDHRGSIFVVQLNEMFVKNANFRPIVVIKQTAGSDRRGLPNSFLNRFIKIRVKDVSKSVKIKYLQTKYDNQQNMESSHSLWSYIDEVLTWDPKIRIQLLQYVCILHSKGDAYFQKSIKILNLPDIKTSSTIFSLPSEQKVLKLLPIRSKYPSTQNINQIQSLIKCYITLNYSSFSLCIIGSVNNRENIVHMLGYLLNKTVVKVILSTMTDMADLLGTYQQLEVNHEQEEEQNMQQQVGRSEAESRIGKKLKKLSRRQKNMRNIHKGEQNGTNFKYIQSRIIKTLKKKAQNILYIEVPNQMMLQRVQKGLKPVFEQKVNIIVGIDSTNNPNVCNNTKFIPIHLSYGHNLNTSIHNIYAIFEPNYTNLIYSDEEIRKQQTQMWIQQCCEQQSNRKIVKAWQRLYTDIKNGIYTYWNKQEQQQIRKKKEEEIFEHTCKQVGIYKQYQQCNRYTHSQQIQTLQTISKNNLQMCSSKEQNQLIHKIINLFILEMLTANSHQIKQQQAEDIAVYNSSIGQKFQFLYISDFGQTGSGFRQQAYRLLSLCYQYVATSDIRQINSYASILDKFIQQTQQLYTKATLLYEKQILIRFNEQQHKIIPILTPNCPKSIYHYALANIPYSVNKLAGLHIDFSIIAKWQMEKQIINYLGWISVDMFQAAGWLTNLCVRDLPVYLLVKDQVVTNNLDYFTHAADKIKNIILLNKKLWDILTRIKPQIPSNIETSKSQSCLQLGYQIFKAFRPSNNQYLNLSVHIQTQCQLKTLQLLCQQDKFYLQVYRKLCQVKYSGYRPNSFQCIQQKITLYDKQHQELKAKRYIYRGYDNIKLLKDFYQQYTIYCQEIERHQFDSNVIKKILHQLYQTYYHQYKDILWPIFASLIIIHSQTTKQDLSRENSITQAILAQTHSSKSFQQAVKLMLLKQQQQIYDAAKNYTKYQRKFKNTVIVDQYTEQGVRKNKEEDQQEFMQFFGKGSQKQQTILDQLYMLVRKRAGCKFQLKLHQNIFSQITQFSSFVVAFELKFSNINDHAQSINSKSQINIYEQYSLGIVSKLTQPIPKILQKVKYLLSKYNIDSVRIIGTLCNKIQEHKAHEQVYKILIDCQFLILKIYEVNSVLPMAERIATEQIQNLCLNVRRIELNNWKSMLDVKINRVEKSDTLEFIQFYRNFVQIGNIGESQSLQAKECFRICDDFMRQSKISCYQYRLYLLGLVCQNMDSNKLYIKYNVDRIINFYVSLRQPIMQFWQRVKKEKIKQMNQYQKLVKWDSNRYLVFKEGCQKFQKKIHNILKKYEEQLSIQVGVFHTNLRNKHICQSIDQFSNTHKMKQQSERMFQNLQFQEYIQQNINTYEGVVERIFESLQLIKQQQYNTQSKMLLIRNSLAQLEELTQSLPSFPYNTANLESHVLTQQMFHPQHPQYYQKAVKYYFGMWDKLCQKTQTAWNRDIVERVWSVGEKIWANVNSRIPNYSVEIDAQLDEQTDNILILFDRFLAQQPSNSTHHHIFVKEVEKIKKFLRQKQKIFHQKLESKYPKLQNAQQAITLMKIGYIVCSIALNLEKNGLCVKQNQEEAQKSQNEEVGDGVGIGEGQAHEGAQNVGDQIEFQEQIQGHKEQQKNNDANANKKDQNDIEMQGDFQGDMYSKSQQQENDDQKQGQEKQAEQKMGQVDNQQRQQDMKNEQGKAEGSQKADVDIDGQQQGSQQLVDNEKQQKQARKGQKGNEESDQEGQQQKSDWDDNNEQGEKIQKQDEKEKEDNEEDGDEGSDNDMSDEERSGSNEQQQENKDKQKQESLSKSDDNNSLKDQNQQGSQQGNRDGQILSQQMNEQENEENEEKQKKFLKSKRTNIQAYGRSDMNSNNPLKNDQNLMENEDMQNIGGAAQAQGAKDGQKGSGDPVHSLSAQLLKQIQNLERITAKQNANFMKDLNVVAHDQQYEQFKQGQERQEQQYQITQEDNKISTNLAAFMDEQRKKNEQEQKKQKEEKEDSKKNQRKQQKQLKRQKNEKKKDQKKSVLEKGKANDKNEEKLQKIQEMKNQQDQNNDQKNPQKEEQNSQKGNVNREEKVLEISGQQYLKSIVNSHQNLTKAKNQAQQDENQQSADIMDEAFQISKILEEQLKSVLQPMDNAQYRGDYKTGKKLNLKKIIPFIASNFRKDKIWLRRTEPSQRNYYIMIALDDTKSMKHGAVGSEALKGLLAISLALQHLSIKTCITGIRDSMNIYKNFQELLEPGKIIRNFDFSHQSQVSHDLSIASFMSASLQQFKKSQSSETGVENKQLCFIISDGKMNKDYVRPYLREAKKRDIIFVFIIVDSEKASIMTTKSVQIDPFGKVKMKLYLSDFPFEYFLIVRNVRQLGDVLATTLLQFIQQK